MDTVKGCFGYGLLTLLYIWQFVQLFLRRQKMGFFVVAVWLIIILAIILRACGVI